MRQHFLKNRQRLLSGHLPTHCFGVEGSWSESRGGGQWFGA